MMSWGEGGRGGGCDLLDIVLLVLLSDLDVLPIRYQLVSLELTQSLVVDSKEHLQTTLLYVVLPV